MSDKINIEILKDIQRDRFYYTWRDLLIALYFVFLLLSGVLVQGDHFSSTNMQFNASRPKNVIRREFSGVARKVSPL